MHLHGHHICRFGICRIDNTTSLWYIFKFCIYFMFRIICIESGHNDLIVRIQTHNCVVTVWHPVKITDGATFQTNRCGLAFTSLINPKRFICHNGHKLMVIGHVFTPLFYIREVFRVILRRTRDVKFRSRCKHILIKVQIHPSLQ